MSRRLIQNADVAVDANRAFPVKVGYSNLQHHGVAPNQQMYLSDLVALRSQIPVKRGIYTTHGLNQTNLSQSGAGFIDDARNYGRRGVKFLRNKAGDALEYGANHGIDYAANYGKQRVGSVAKRVRGDGFLRSLAGNAAIGIGNLVGNTIKGGSARPANFGPRRRPIKSLVYSPEQEMAIMSAQAGSGFLRNLAGNAVKGIGNLVGNTIKGGEVKRKRKAKGKGLVAPGMVR